MFTLPTEHSTAGWTNKDWDRYLTSIGFKFVRMGKHGAIYVHPDIGRFQISGSPSDGNTSRARWRELKHKLEICAADKA